MSFIESGHSEIVMNKLKKSLVRNHIAFVYEDVCKERMWELNAEDRWSFNFTKLGRYWDARTESDIAALDPEGKNLILGECKYWQEPVMLMYFGIWKLLPAILWIQFEVFGQT